ncbi:hypothetical protein [Nonomuraea sp. NPDC049309]
MTAPLSTILSPTRSTAVDPARPLLALGRAGTRRRRPSSGGRPG